MTVKRISSTSLNKLLNGNTIEPATCLIKVYSNDCNYCHNLKDYFEDIAQEYQDFYFYAFNIHDDRSLENRLGFQGVPTILKIDTTGDEANVNVLEEPEDPNELTYYKTSHIKQFIEED
mgnify:CR=1 FL=1